MRQCVVDGCTKVPARNQRICPMHRTRQYRYGTYTPTFRTREDRFWLRVDRSAGPHDCWPWLGHHNPSGYGRINTGTLAPRNQLAHRLAYTYAYGIEPGPCIMHTCDNPSCCNPTHLVDATIAENNADTRRKGRHRGAPGSRNSHSRVNERDVQIIRVLAGIGCTLREIAERYDIGLSTTQKIVRHETWQHVPDYNFMEHDAP